MKEITGKLIKKAIEDFRPVAEDMAKKGAEPDEIVAAFNAHMKIRQAHYYGEANKIKPIREILTHALRNVTTKTSEAEWIFYDLLTFNEIDFKYQYQIGPYTADFLFKNNLVLEIDGPDHEKAKDETRDKYFKKMGYKTLRVPLAILFHSPHAVIEEIEALL